jgi:hypothetical protein
MLLWSRILLLFGKLNVCLKFPSPISDNVSREDCYGLPKNEFGVNVPERVPQNDSLGD